MEIIINGFSNRELALFIWSGIIFISLLFNKGIRSSLIGIFASLLNGKLLSIFLIMTIYVLFMVAVLNRIGLWHIDFLRDTLFWFFGTAFILMTNVNKINQIKYFKTILKSTIKWTIIVEFLSHIYTFSLPVELILVPCLFIISFITAMIDIKKEYKPLSKFLKSMWSIIGLITLIFFSYKLYNDWRILFTINNLESLILSPILTILYLPLLYCLALYLHYEVLFVMLGLNRTDFDEVKKVKWIIVKKATLNINRLDYISQNIYRIEYRGSDHIKECLSRLYRRSWKFQVVPSYP